MDKDGMTCLQEKFSPCCQWRNKLSPAGLFVKGPTEVYVMSQEGLGSRDTVWELTSSPAYLILKVQGGLAGQKDQAFQVDP